MNSAINLGRRIQSRLAEMGHKRSYLYEKIPALRAPTLSLLITRNSRRSKFDAEIADALGVTLLWLNTGQTPKLISTAKTRNALGERLSDLVYQGDLITAATLLLQNMPKAEQGAVFQQLTMSSNKIPEERL